MDKQQIGNESLQSAVVPFFNSHTNGCGFFTKDYFVTCGHCLNNGSITIKVGDEFRTFTKDEAIVFDTIDNGSNEKQIGDIAIFRCFGQKHYLNIADKITNDKMLGDFILPHYVFHTESEPSSDSLHSPNILTYFHIAHFSMLESHYLTPYASRLFEARTDSIIREGSSGSPLLNQKNEVVGILIGCLNESKHPDIILFGKPCSYFEQLQL